MGGSSPAASRGIFDTDGFVTSEAVELDLPAAALPLRMAGGLLDLLVVLALALTLVWAAPWTWVAADQALLQAGVILVLIACLLALPVTLETLLRGRTLGKLALGLRTVRDDAGPIGFRHALIRGLAGVVEIWLSVGGLAVLVAATNERAKRLGDLLAGTYVVRERVRMALPPPPAMPGPLAGWAAGADVGVLPDGLAVALRQFLIRGADLTPQARASTAAALLGDLRHHVAPPPPAGAPPEAVMAAVLAERRRRDLDRAARHDALRARVLGPDPLGTSPRPLGDGPGTGQMP